MKKNLLLLTTLLLTLKVGYGQTNIYHPFPEDSATWVVDNYSHTCMGYCGSEIYKMQGDTVINSISYNKIYWRSIKFNYDGVPPVFYSNLSPIKYWAGIRQDIIHRKVYIILPSMISDTLLYDFNLKVGDKLPHTYVNSQPRIVTKLDSILISGKYHKVFIFDNGSTGPFPTSGNLIEGVGSGGRLDYMDVFFEGGPVAACFNGNAISPVYPECAVNAFTVSIFDGFAANRFKIFPNPFSSSTTLQAVQSFKDANLVVYNAMGQQMKQIKNISGHTVTLNRDNLPGGIYFLRLTDENKIYTDKLLIIDN